MLDTGMNHKPGNIDVARRIQRGLCRDQIGHLRPVERQCSPDKRRFSLLTDEKSEANSALAISSSSESMPSPDSQSLPAPGRSFQVQLSNQRHQQLLPVLITRQN